MSIEAQLVELEQFAKRENLTIAKQFVESKSAKAPGREVFNHMLSAIYKSKEPVGILAWHPDRLARNSVDGGQIIYLVDTGKVIALKFPTFWFEPTPQGLFMLQVAFGQSKYYSDNLSENVKRGIRQKLRKGEWPGPAPFGYVNNRNTHSIDPDPVKAKIVRRIFEEYATGEYNLRTIGEHFALWGVVSASGKPLAKSTLKHLLTHQAYIGTIIWSGEPYEGSFPPLVPKDVFETVQHVIKSQEKRRYVRRKHDFSFLGLFRCGECGGAITAQLAKGNGGTYRYYRCTKKFGLCKQGYIQESDFAVLLRKEVNRVAINEQCASRMLEQVKLWEREENVDGEKHTRERKTKLEVIDQKLDTLVNAFLEGTLEKETYLKKKAELIDAKAGLREEKVSLQARGAQWIEPLRNWINRAHHAQNLASSDDLSKLKSFVENIGTNRLLLDRKPLWTWEKPWKILAENSRSMSWLGDRDSNPD